MCSLNSLNSVTQNIYLYSKRAQPLLVQETRMLPQRQQGICERHDLKIDPNSCLSDLSDSLISLNFHTI